MNRRRQTIQLFGVSFLDVLFCALGGVLMLLMYAMWSSELRIGLIGAERDGLIAENEKLSGVIERLTGERGQLIGRNKKLTGEGKRLTGEIDRLMGENKRLTGENHELKDGGDRLRGQLSELRSQIRGVIGLKGKMQNVVFVVDRSESLGRGPDAQARFDDCKKLLAAWIDTLAFKEFNVVQFNNLVDVPGGWQGKLVDGTDQNRQQAVQYVHSLQAAGTTNTMGALQHALGLPGVDAVVLFSDGWPDGPNGRTPTDTAGKDRATDWILDYLRDHNRDSRDRPKVTINTVAVGNYLNTVYGNFLQNIAKENGGVFIGR